MKAEAITRSIGQLPVHEQHEVVDFIEFLKSRHHVDVQSRRKRSRFSQEPFVGMWRNRQDMNDSAAWVRDLRREQWARHG
jgi:hypothetical protein